MASKPKAPGGIVPTAWKAINDQPKTLLVWPTWPVVEPPPSGRRVKLERDALHTTAAETIDITIPLGDEHGVGLEGTRLRIIAWPFRRHTDVTATLEVVGGRSTVTIARLDAWPLDPHLNLMARRHSALSHLPAKVDGSHVHRFPDNARLGAAAFFPHGNLPIAAPILDELISFRDFVRILGVEFNIRGTDMISSPDWQSMI